MKLKLTLLVFASIVMICSTILVISAWTHQTDVNETIKNIEALSDGEDYGGGTCCVQDIAICIYGTHAFPGYYFIPAGPCKTDENQE